jgi:hypothetical protein
MTAAVGAAVAAHDYFGRKTRVMIGRVLVPTEDDCATDRKGKMRGENAK